MPTPTLFSLTETKEDKIIKLVAKRFKVPFSKLIHKDNRQQYADPRRVCWYLLRRHTTLEQEQIAKIFSGRNRSCISLGEKYIQTLPKKSTLWEDIKLLDAVCSTLK
jgi:chromosomal replication initiation ATPase DnaA